MVLSVQVGGVHSMVGLIAYVAALIAAAAGLVMLYVICAGHDRGLVRSRSVRRRSMLAFFGCTVSLIAVMAGVVILLNMAVVASDTASKKRLAHTPPTFTTAGTAPASRSVVSSAIAMPAAPSVKVMVERPEQTKRKKAAAKPKPRFVDRRPSHYSWGGQGNYPNW
jgi:hypothetical protein